MKKTYNGIIILFLIMASGIAFSPVIGNDFIQYDDDMFITENNPIKSGIHLESIKWALTTSYLSYWHPLTWLSHMLDWSIFGANASGHHLISLFLHIGTAIFLFLFLNKATGKIWPAVFAAAFFALHPLRVESVAWAAERKDVLSMFFGMACIYAYAFYAERPGLWKYSLCLMLFIFALMSKPMLVTLPFVLLLLDYWPLQRRLKTSDEQGRRFHSLKIILLEKVPFILMTLTVSMVTLWAQNKVGATSFGENLSLTTRLANAMVTYVTYLGKTLCPLNLALHYPYDASLPLWKVFASGIILLIITMITLLCIRKKPFWFTGWFWYLGALIPVIGLVQSGTQAMADRYTYLPSVGVAIILTWSISSLEEGNTINKKILWPAAVCILMIMAVLTWRQCGFWKNSIDIWSHTSKVTKYNYLAYSRLGNAYGEMKQYRQAIYYFNEVLRVRPDYVIAHNGKGVSYNAMGMPRAAINEFDKALEMKPDYGAAYNNRAFSYFMLKDTVVGCRDAQKACALKFCKTLYWANSRGFCRYDLSPEN